MELSDAIRSRRSVRAFRPTPIPEEQIEELLEHAAWAPSAGNLQSRDFVIVRDEEMRRGLAHAAFDQDFLAEAPCIVVVCTNAERVRRYGERGRGLYTIQDAAASTQNLLLAVHAAGLGATWVGAFDEEAVRVLLDLPPHARAVALVPIGRPAETPDVPSRLPVDAVVHWERW